MPFIGRTPTAVPLTSSDIAADIINNTHIGDTAISGFDALATAPADTDEFLISDAGTLKRIDASLVGGGGITEADQYRLSASLSSNVDPISSNLERVDDASFAKIGTGMSVSSGVFSFATTGIYRVSYFFIINCTSADNGVVSAYVTTNDGGAWDLVAVATAGANTSSGAGNTGSASAEFLVDVTDVSNVKVKFVSTSLSNCSISGNTDYSDTAFSFIRLGDT